MAQRRFLKIPKFLRPGAIDFTEPMTELIVPNGQAVSLGDSTSNLHEVIHDLMLAHRE